jgi:hypothetical protein
MSFDYSSYELRKRSAQRLVEALKDILGERDELARLAPYIAGARDCDDLEAMLDVYFAWESLKWAYSPRGRPPSVKKELVKRVLCNTGLPVDEEFLRELSQPGGLEGEAGTGEEL